MSVIVVRNGPLATVIDQGENTSEARRQAGIATTEASIAMTAATAISAAARYFASQSAGEAGSTTGQFFSYPDGAGGLVYAQRTSGGSTILGYAATKSQIDALGSGIAATASAAQTLELLSILPGGGNAVAGMHVYLLDSLTAGAYGPPASWRQGYEAGMRANAGYGGPGYQPLTYGYSVERGAGYGFGGTTGAFTLNDGSADDIAYSAYSPSGHGLRLSYSASTPGTFGWGPEAQWTTAKMFYLKGPTLGAFKWWWDIYSPTTGVTVDCYAATWQIAVLTLTAPGNISTGFNAVAVPGTHNATGPVVFFGADWVYDATKFRPGYLAEGGRQLSWVAAQNSTARRAFFAATTPAVVWLDAGMNDRVTRTAAQHAADLTTIITDIQAASPATQVVIVQSLYASDAATTYLAAYTPQKIAVAQTLNCAFYDDRVALGLPDYATAAAAGMMGDAVHPSGKGNFGRAQKRLLFLGASLAAKDPGEVAYASGAGGTYGYSGTLTAKNGVALPKPVSAVTGGTATVSGTTLTKVGSPTGGALAVGQLIVMAGLPVGTIIKSGSGSTWTLSNSATIGTATAFTGYTVSRVVLWKLGLTNGYPQAVFTFDIASTRNGTGDFKRTRAFTELLNGTNVNYITAAYPMAVVVDASGNAGDGASHDFVIDTAINGNFCEIAITSVSLGYDGVATARGAYLFSLLGVTGQSVFEN